MKKIILFAFVTSMLLSSCALFKKNKCQSCPKWNNIEQLDNEEMVENTVEKDCLN